jgi:DNA recombination protein Rad52
MDWNKPSDELAKPLQSSVVKSRQQGGNKVSYVEGWHIIAEANRIFGFENWTRETIDLKCVQERPRPIGRAPNIKDGFSVSYIARVRVVVGGVVREGCGAGHGIDQDCGQAHESAVKEAETDAMKRAFMTFGNPFGLALYDKAKANVSDDPVIDFDAMANELIAIVDVCTTSNELAELKASARFVDEQNQLPEIQFQKLAIAYQKKRAALVPKAVA